MEEEVWKDILGYEGSYQFTLLKLLLLILG
ncbi:hypothetical protein [Staphylococcus phage PMBT8]|nr:hypothetical protein [Staphylococcus phage PMBT8]